ncbi:MAG: transporter substrate-binding domain-containing protein [Marinobacter sp.]|nr:transporter substrate-binding domain-containing protein [Marinobacter sp.]
MSNTHPLAAGYHRSLMGLLLLLFVVASAHAGEQVRLTNGEWPPYLSEQLPHYGLASRIVTEAFQRAGIEVEYGFFPWSRSLFLAENGSWDGSVVWLRSPEREQRFHFSEPVITSGYVWFHLADRAFDWQTMDDLTGMVVGATLKYDYGAAFDEAEASGIISVQRVPRDELNFLKLLHGRIDVFPMDRIVGLDMLRRHHPPEVVARITYHDLPLRNDPLHLIMSLDIPENADRIRRFNASLKAMREAGVIERFLQEGLGNR